MLPRLPPREDPLDECAGASVQGGEAQDEGGWGVPQRDECADVGDGDYTQEQRGVGAEALPLDGRPRSSRKNRTHNFRDVDCWLSTILVGGISKEASHTPIWEYMGMVQSHCNAL